MTKARKSQAAMGIHRTNLRMSKLARSIQSTSTKANWAEMAKILFWGDADQGRHNEVVRLFFRENRPSADQVASASYDYDQVQYILVLMLVLTTAEKRTQELYQQDFSHRCDAISDAHGLKEDQYWMDAEVPPEWEQLDREFEKGSVQILLDTLREYSMDEIADHLEVAGPQQFFDIIGSLEVQFLKLLRQPRPGMLKVIAREHRAIPEILQSSSPAQQRTEK